MLIAKTLVSSTGPFGRNNPFKVYRSMTPDDICRKILYLWTAVTVFYVYIILLRF